MRGIAAIALIALAGIAGWYGRGYYEANRYVDGPCFVSGVRSNAATGQVVVDCVMGKVTYGPARIMLTDSVQTAVDDPDDTSYVKATIWIEGEPIGTLRREWLYDVKNVIEAAKGRGRVQPTGG